MAGSAVHSGPGHTGMLREPELLFCRPFVAEKDGAGALYGSGCRLLCFAFGCLYLVQ